MLIAILTDFGVDSIYVSQMKGVIKSINHNADIIDITHSIPPQNIEIANFILYNIYKYYPKNTIFVSVIDPDVGTNREILLMKTDNYYFLAPNNGILSKIISNTKKFEVFKIELDYFSNSEISPTFHGRDIFAPIAAYITLNRDINEFTDEMLHSKIFLLNSEFNNKEEVFKGKIMMFDNFGNAITNIEKGLLKNSNYKFKYNEHQINQISKTYSDVDNGEVLAYIGSLNNLEFGIRNGNFKERFNVKLYDEFKIIQQEQL